MYKILNLFILGTFISLSIVDPVEAAYQSGECDAAQGINWREVKTRSFTILYTESSTHLAELLAAQRQSSVLDLEYARFEALFGITLSPSILIRIYPDYSTYTCLSVRSENYPSSSSSLIHTNTGLSEISLVGENIIESFPAWMNHQIDFFRYDLAVIFAGRISGDKIPPGLVVGIGHFAQDPLNTVGTLRLDRENWLTDVPSLHNLWEDRASQNDLVSQVQATSTIAYLVDTYGWPAFLVFLENLKSEPDYTSALNRTYKKTLAELENGWQVYYPRYIQGSWRFHPFYDPDLDPYLWLIKAEKYGDAAMELKEAIALLEKSGNTKALNQARVLYQMAQKGSEAERLYAQSVQAFQSGNYQESLDFLKQAEISYAETTNRFFHLDEYAAHRQQVNSALGLQHELDVLQGALTTQWNTFTLGDRLLNIGDQFRVLGDSQGFSRTKAMIEIVEARQRSQFSIIISMGFVIVLALLLLLTRLIQQIPPPESQL